MSINRRTLLVVIPVLVLLGNGIGYLIISRGRGAPGTSAPASQATSPQAEGAGPRAEAPAPSAAERAAGDKDEAVEAAAAARRAAGLVALEAGEYDKALIQFTAAQALVGEKARVTDLIRVTEELRGARPAPAFTSRFRPSGSTASRSRGSSPRRTATREPEPPSSEPPSLAPAAPAGGTLIVTTTPRGLLVQVDDAPVDLTPMRVHLKPGAHRVALLDGNRRLHEETVDIRDGSTATLLKDLAAAMTPEPLRPTVTAPAPSGLTAATFVAPARTEAPPASTVRAAEVVDPGKGNGVAAKLPSSTSSTSASSSPPIGAPRSAELIRADPGAPSGASTRTGALYVTSPGLYGVVWVNGRPRGYPPLSVSDLPPGPAKVEIRVNGVQKRVSSVVVQPSTTQTVQLLAAKP